MSLAVNQKPLSYKYLLSLPEDTRYELLDGAVYGMAAPGLNHQVILSYLHAEIFNYLRDKQCIVLPAPLDVFFIDGDEDIEDCINVVQPDISVVCDRNKLVKRGCKGSPDFIVEIVSASSKAMDYTRKHYLYSRFGVREYWIVNPMDKSILVYKSEDGTFTKPQIYDFDSTVRLGIFNDLVIDFSRIDLLI